MTLRNAHRFDEFSEDEIEGLVGSLQSINEGELGVSMLVACGARAIPVLRHYLLEGRPRVLYQPRQRAVRALAELGAKEVLLEYLASPKDHLSPEIRYAEEAVESTAARLLSRWRTDDVFQVLLTVVSRRVVAGAIETLGEFRRPEALPEMIRLLGDDVGRTFAADAIRKVADMAVDDLLEAALTPDPNRPRETPSSLVRRRQALRLVWETRSFAAAVSRIDALMYDQDVEIAAVAAQMVLTCGNAGEQVLAIEKLLDVYKSTSWITQADIQQTLQSALEIARPIVEKRAAVAKNLSYSEVILFRNLTSSNTDPDSAKS